MPASSSSSSSSQYPLPSCGYIPPESDYQSQGETLAHILNGVLNRPVRDALLLHQALAETSKDRTELLVSRLVRFHWEPKHLERVKAAYRQKYANRLEEDIADGTKGDFGEFVKQLCRVES